MAGSSLGLISSAGDSSRSASLGSLIASASCDLNQSLVSMVCVPSPVAPSPAFSHAGSSPSSPPPAIRDKPSRALLNSLGTIHILFASPWAICGNVCRY
jgi:hypothetical protein